MTAGEPRSDSRNSADQRSARPGNSPHATAVPAPQPASFASVDASPVAQNRRRVAYRDAHNHLQDVWLAPHLERVCAQLEALPIRAAVVNGTVDNDWSAVAELARRFSWVKPSYGVHPWLVGNRGTHWLEALKSLLKEDAAAGVGEIGLDRWILDSARPDDPRLAGLRRAPLEEQREVFTIQLQLAAAENRAVTIHCLDAWGMLTDVLANSPLPARGFLLHAYGGSSELADHFARHGAYFSFNGYFLGDRKERQREVFRTIPLDRLLVETDAPSMPLPQAWRTYKLPPTAHGQPVNHPANIEAVYAGLASLRGLPLEELAQIVDANFRRFFGYA
ncbi:TatD family deoxyribonuclease [Opitutaceae bacterium EW11]|nr:TatD family deoxyribonuclease [Opitutaceae bacterium EW11]